MQSKEHLTSKSIKDVIVEEYKQQGHVAGNPHGAEPEPLTSVVAPIPSRRRASQSSAGRRLDQHGKFVASRESMTRGVQPSSTNFKLCIDTS